VKLKRECLDAAVGGRISVRDFYLVPASHMAMPLRRTPSTGPPPRESTLEAREGFSSGDARPVGALHA
jgi:hypothetical protein